MYIYILQFDYLLIAICPQHGPIPVVSEPWAAAVGPWAVRGAWGSRPNRKGQLPPPQGLGPSAEGPGEGEGKGRGV